MFNANKPANDDLPTTSQLVRSTLIALAAAIVILVTIVLPAEYAIDPTGAGRVLGLTRMGEIKEQLAAEADADEVQAAPIVTALPVAPAPAIAPAEEAPPSVTEADTPVGPPGPKSDEVSFTLKPSEGVEYKMSMREGAKVSFSWQVAGGAVNYDLHGTAKSGSETSYRKGRGIEADSGDLVAAFDGSHGWFWRNRGSQDVTVTLKTTGEYAELKRVK